MVNDLRSEMQDRIDMLNNELTATRKLLSAVEPPEEGQKLARLGCELAKTLAALRETKYWANRLERVSTQFVNDLKKSL